MADEQSGHDPERPVYADGNTAPDGSYIVGKGKPPESSKFRKNDGRKRGRRTKGTSNLHSDVRAELERRVDLTVDGVPKRVSRQRAIVMRLMNTASAGDLRATKLAFDYSLQCARIEGPEQEESVGFSHLNDLSEEELKTLEILMSKACGVVVPPDPPELFAHVRDPNDSRNNRTEHSVDGVSRQICSIAGIEPRLIGIENRAYAAAAIARRPGCNHHVF